MRDDRRAQEGEGCPSVLAQTAAPISACRSGPVGHACATAWLALSCTRLVFELRSLNSDVERHILEIGDLVAGPVTHIGRHCSVRRGPAVSSQSPSRGTNPGSIIMSRRSRAVVPSQLWISLAQADEASAMMSAPAASSWCGISYARP
jgi:hypothetical protein